jgi:hypothetical protein
MTTHELSFPCASPLRLDASLQCLLETDPRNIYNPYPDIAGIRNYRQSRTQPLTKMTYISSAACWDVIHMHAYHEASHLVLDYTPFKAWGRFLLFLIYGKIWCLLITKEWDEKTQDAWNEIKQLRHELGRAYSAAALSEELLANGLCFFDCKDPQVKAMEKVVIQKAAEDFPHADFEGLYYRTIRPIIEWQRDKLGLVEFLSIFLQALERSEDSSQVFKVTDSQSRCDLLDDSIKGIRSAQQASDWLASATTFEIATIRLLRGKFVEKMRSHKTIGLSMLASALYGVAGGKKLPRLIFNEAKYIRRLPIGGPTKSYIRLFPREVSGRWYFRPKVELHKKGHQADALRTVGWYESIFEQLTRNPNHLICPNYIPGCCSCSLSQKQAMTRLSKWASDGKFGMNGSRRDLPAECSVEI